MLLVATPRLPFPSGHRVWLRALVPQKTALSRPPPRHAGAWGPLRSVLLSDAPFLGFLLFGASGAAGLPPTLLAIPSQAPPPAPARAGPLPSPSPLPPEMGDPAPRLKSYTLRTWDHEADAQLLASLLGREPQAGLFWPVQASVQAPCMHGSPERS